MKIDEFITKTGTKVPEFAKALNVSKATAYRWLDGSRFPNRKKLQEIYKLTEGKVTPNDLILQNEVKPNVIQRIFGG